jgi:hypothetical protein
VYHYQKPRKNHRAFKAKSFGTWIFHHEVLSTRRVTRQTLLCAPPKSKLQTAKAIEVSLRDKEKQWMLLNCKHTRRRIAEKPKRNNNNSNNNNNDNMPWMNRQRQRHRGQSPPPLHNNSQHVLAIVSTTYETQRDDRIVAAFSKTSALPCDVWRWNGRNGTGNLCSRTPSVLLASNYPHCILESDNFCVLSAGFPYHYKDAFCNDDENDDDRDSPASKSFSKTVLEYCEAIRNQQGGLHEKIGRCLKKVSGHFSLFLLHKASTERNQSRFWAWNDAFGFMPVYCCHQRRDGNNSDAVVLSSHWDCLVPAITAPPTTSSASLPLELDWDIVAEYLTFGTTLGGKRKDNFDGGGRFDRTLVRGIENLSPGTCLSIVESSSSSLSATARSYTTSYGACEVLLSATNRKSGTAKCWDPTPFSNDTLRIKGVKLAEAKKNKFHGEKMTLISPLPTSMEDSPKSIVDVADDCDGVTNPLAPLAEMFQAFSSCIDEATAQGQVGRAALTGGGDTRLILACLLLQQQRQYEKQQHSKATPEMDSSNPVRAIIFQTHAKQKTDWLIAHHLATLFGLAHEQTFANSNMMGGWYDHSYLRLRSRREEACLSNLHDQIPLRRKQKKAADKHKEDILSYTLHGRFGTEFLGCLCFDKSPLDVRNIKEVEELRPKATKRFCAIFRSSASGEDDTISNPMEALCDRFAELEKDQATLEDQSNDGNAVGFDTGYAFQLQLYTRSCLSDIYKGLRGGSWFSIPNAMFSRNAITPFLDNTLLRLLMCSVSVREKEEPYELYGKLYQLSHGIPSVLLKVPSNNKLLCTHTTIPRAIKAAEAASHPYVPTTIRAPKANKSPRRQQALDLLRDRFHPVFWKGAIAIFRKAPVKMDVDGVANDAREDVRALVDLVGNAQDACVLSGRLQSFVLWHGRVLLHCEPSSWILK